MLFTKAMKGGARRTNNSMRLCGFACDSFKSESSALTKRFPQRRKGAKKNSRCQKLLFIIAGCVLLFAAMRQAAQTRRPQRVVTTLTDVVYAIRFSPDSKTLAIARGSRDDNRVELWDTATGTLRHAIKGFDGAIWSISFAPD